MVVHVRYNAWYISLPSPEELQRKMTTTSFVNFYLECNAALHILPGDSFDSEKQTKWL